MGEPRNQAMFRAYAGKHTDRLGTFERVVSQTLRHLGRFDAAHPVRVLDVGSSDGAALVRLARVVSRGGRDVEVIAVEPEEEALSAYTGVPFSVRTTLMRRRVEEQLDEWDDSGYPANFTLITCIHSAYHFSPRAQTLHRLASRLSNNGALVVFTDDGNCPLYELVGLLRERWPHSRTAQYGELLSASQIERELRAGGLAVGSMAYTQSIRLNTVSELIESIAFIGRLDVEDLQKDAVWVMSEAERRFGLLPCTVPLAERALTVSKSSHRAGGR